MQLGETVSIRETLTATAVFTVSAATYTVVNEATGATAFSGSATITSPGTASQVLSFLFTPAAVGNYLVTFTYTISSEVYTATQRVRVTVSPSGLEVLLGMLRDLIGDQPSTTQTFSDFELEEILAQWQRNVDAEELEAIASYSAASGQQFLKFQSAWPYWAQSVTLQDGNYATLTPATADLLAGTWTFATEPDLPVLATGAAYDLHGAASAALVIWATRKARDYDFESNTQRFYRSQMRIGLMEQARAFQARSVPSL